MNSTMTKVEDLLKEMGERTSYNLAHEAECMWPDHHTTSPGAKFLTGIRDAVIDQADDIVGDQWEDIPWEIADAAVPVYTHELWMTFVDLGAYREDPEELGSSDDMDGKGRTCLYLIADRLARSMVGELRDAAEDDADAAGEA